MFYPDGRAELLATLDHDLADAVVPTGATQPKALIVPHAGYRYSGPVAATAYARLAPFRDRINRVVLLGPAHRVHVRSMALSSADAFLTPLGAVRLDDELRARVRELPGVVVDDRAHAPEHSLEVHLPFLQRVLGDGFALLPIVVGGARTERVADVLDAVWGGDETLFVISTDLSHYHPYATARRLDAATADVIVRRDWEALEPDRACGAFPVRGLLEAARRHGLAVELVDLRNSGDTAGPRDQVVGYGAFVATSPVPAPPGPGTASDADVAAGTDAATGGERWHVPATARAVLLDVAEEAIRSSFEHRPAGLPTLDAVDPVLAADGASFVTLREGSRLLGCIGTIEPRQALLADVAENAVHAAFDDPRMPPLTPAEFTRMELKVSVLTPTEPMDVHSLEELAAAVRPGVDGLLVVAGRRRGTFLPSVWAELADVPRFLDHLWRKAGLRPGTWPPDTTVYRYGTEEFGREGPRRPVRS
jgi:hypothetical protein